MPVLSNAEGPAPTPPPAPPDDIPFLRFAPVPVRSRRDGWTPELQFRFVLALARGAGVDEAARSLGRSRQGAYALRQREGAEGFAAAWDGAAEFARGARGAAAGLPLGFGQSAIETVLVPRTYRGRLIGFTQREDLTGAMARLRRLDRLAERIEAQEQGRARAASARPAPFRRTAGGR
ncbi:MAG TPA: hypothetical protein VF614_01970 [Chthoniobacteraceae bacterium]|jgi:hypothetical protein